MRWIGLSRQAAKMLVTLLAIWLAIFAVLETGLSFIPLYPNWLVAGLGIVVVFFSLLIYWTQCGREIDIAMVIRPARRFVRRWLRRYIGAEALIAAFFTFRPPSMGMGLTLALTLLVIGVILTRRVWRVLCFLGIIGLGVAGFHRLMTDDRPRNPIPRVVGDRYEARVGVGKARLDLGAAEDLAEAAALGVAALDAEQEAEINMAEVQAFQIVVPGAVFLDTNAQKPGDDVRIPKVGEVVDVAKSSMQMYTELDPATGRHKLVYYAFATAPAICVLLPDKDGIDHPFWVKRRYGRLVAASEAKNIMAAMPREEPKKPEPLAVPTGYAVVWRDRVNGWMDTELTVEEVFGKNCVIYPCEQTQTRLGRMNPPANSVPQWQEQGGGAACYLEPQMADANRSFRIWINSRVPKEVMILKKV